jgi:RNA polymerase sigma factor (sigma-70 family)
MAEPNEQNEQLVDELLVMESQDGSAEALAALVSRWQRRLWRYAYRLTGNAEAAWEVTQESWLGVLRGLSRLDDPARFKPWVYRIVTHKARDWIARSVKGRRRRAESVPAEPESAPAHEQEVADELQSLMNRLPEPSRTVLTLYYLEGLPLAEIAGILGIPAGTVKSRLHTARSELKALWQQASQ